MKGILLVLLMQFAAVSNSQDGIRVEAAWSPARPPGSETGAVYFTLVNDSEQPVELLDGTTPIARKVEVHEHRFEEGMMRMRRVPAITVPAQGRVEFEPMGYHLMLFGLERVPAAGETYPLRLNFADGSVLDLSVEVRGPE